MVSRRSVATPTHTVVAPRALAPSGSGALYPHGGTQSAPYPPRAMADVVMSVTQHTIPPRVVSPYPHSGDPGTGWRTGTGESSPDLR